MVIFAAQRTADDEAGYAAAAETMDRLAAQQPGYCGMISTRGANGFGITVSYWADDNAAKAWRDEPEHSRMREAGRDRWYESYTIDVAEITRGYEWTQRG